MVPGGEKSPASRRRAVNEMLLALARITGWSRAELLGLGWSEAHELIDLEMKARGT